MSSCFSFERVYYDPKTITNGRIYPCVFFFFGGRIGRDHFRCWGGGKDSGSGGAYRAEGDYRRRGIRPRRAFGCENRPVTLWAPRRATCGP